MNSDGRRSNLIYRIFFEKKRRRNRKRKRKRKRKRNDYRCLLHKSEDDARESRDKINNVTAIDTRVRK